MKSYLRYIRKVLRLIFPNTEAIFLPKNKILADCWVRAVNLLLLLALGIIKEPQALS
jgi:hypothetical protein